MSDLPVLQAGPELVLRQETVDAPELGGSVIVRGLMASEAFAVSVLRSQALRTVREARAEWAAYCDKLPPDKPRPDFEAPDLSFEELRTFGLYISQLLACTVSSASGLALYTAEQWEVVPQHHPALCTRLQAVAERLSGLDAEDVEKNSPTAAPS